MGKGERLKGEERIVENGIGRDEGAGVGEGKRL